MTLKKRLASLKGEADNFCEPHLIAIQEACKAIDAAVEAMRAEGCEVTMTYPYGRGEQSKASHISVKVRLTVDLA